MQPSLEQSAVISADFDILVVEAFAGTGKTSTLKEFCCKKIGSRIGYFVYNGTMKDGAKISFSIVPGVEVNSFHSYAYHRVGYRFKDRLEVDLTASYLLPFVADIVSEENSFLYASALLDLLKEFASSMDTMDDFIRYKRREKAEWSARKRVPLLALLPLLEDVWNTVIHDESYPMDHDFYLKLFQLSKPVLEYDYILVDEAQDISPCMIDIILRQRAHARLMFVGDSFQSIYSWRGAVNSLEYISKNTVCETLHLTQSFRCPPSVALLADRVIQHNGARKRFVGTAREEGSIDPVKTYIARNNSTLFDFCVEHIDEKIHFVGGVNKYGLGAILDAKYLQLRRHEFIKDPFIRSFSTFKDLVQHAAKTDDVSLRALAGVLFKYADDDIFDLVRTIRENAVAETDSAQKRVVTAHKCKGLEWDCVVLLDDFPFGKERKMKRLTGVQLKEEYNLLYVAMTRAKRYLELPESLQDHISEM